MKTWIICIVLFLTGCTAMDVFLGPLESSNQAADINKDGVVDPVERKAVGIPVDASPWIDIGLQILAGLSVPGAGALAIAYKVAKQNRRNLEAVIVGVENFKRKLNSESEANELVQELVKAKDEISTNPEALTKFVESVTKPPAT